MTEEQQVKPGYQQFVPPQASPGMYFDPASELFLPRGVRLASRGQVAEVWFLGLGLFIVTLGIGYIAWSLVAWRHGRSPAQRILSLRCWLPEPRRVADRDDMAVRQVLGFCLNGQLLCGFFIWLAGKSLRSVGDFFAGTVILHDPDGVLGLGRLTGESAPCEFISVRRLRVPAAAHPGDQLGDAPPASFRALRTLDVPHVLVLEPPPAVRRRVRGRPRSRRPRRCRWRRG